MQHEQGLILKGVGGFYTILLSSGQEITAKARGKFRREGITPVCGDKVVIAPQPDGDAAMIEILPRRNLMQRPPVANIDQLVIVLAITAPSPDLLLCDKLMLAASLHGIEPVIVFNKLDTASDEVAESFAREYSKHFCTLAVSAQTGAGLDALSRVLADKISCFAGQSAVGKSSLLNELLPGLQLPVGALAQRISRGKHTTRHAQLLPYHNGAVLDTAGFSLLELPFIEQGALNHAYREFGDMPANCRFAACTHRSEPDCAVKALLGQRLSAGRYERYVALCTEFEEMRKHQYD